MIGYELYTINNIKRSQILPEHLRFSDSCAFGITLMLIHASNHSTAFELYTINNIAAWHKPAYQARELQGNAGTCWMCCALGWMNLVCTCFCSG